MRYDIETMRRSLWSLLDILEKLVYKEDQCWDVDEQGEADRCINRIVKAINKV